MTFLFRFLHFFDINSHLNYQAKNKVPQKFKESGPLIIISDKKKRPSMRLNFFVFYIIKLMILNYYLMIGVIFYKCVLLEVQ